MLKVKDQEMATIIAIGLVGTVDNIRPEFRQEALAALERFAFLLFDKSPLGSQAEAFGECLMVEAQGRQNHAA